MAAFPVELKEYQDTPVAELHMQARLDTEVIQAIGKVLVEQIQHHSSNRLILDFSDVPFLASQVLVMIVDIHNRMSRQGGKMVLTHLKPELMQVFTLTRLDHLLYFADSLDDAVRMLAGPEPKDDSSDA